MDRNKIQRVICDTLVDRYELSQNDVLTQGTEMKYLGLDELDLLDLGMCLEDSFGVNFNTPIRMNDTLCDVIDMVENYLNEKAG